MTVTEAWRRFVFHEYQTPRLSLSFYRFFLAIFFLTLYVPRYLWISQFPDSFFRPPPGPTYFFFSGFPPHAFFVGLNLMLITALVYLLAGRRVTLATLVVVGGFLIGNSWAYSFGKIDHDILIVIAPLFLLLAGWNGIGPVRSWPLALWAASVALAMFTAACQKATTGWLDPTTSATLGHSLRNAIFEDRASIAWQLSVQTLPFAAWKAMDYGTVLFEASFPLVVFKRRAFLAACAVACLFHFGVMLVMKIVFITNVVAYASFVRWDIVAARVRVDGVLARAQQWLARRTDAQLLAAASVFSLISFQWGNPLLLVVMSVLPRAYPVPLILVSIAAVVAAIFIVSQCLPRSIWKGRTRVDAGNTV